MSPLMSLYDEPRATEGYVAFEEAPSTPVLKAPHEAEALGLSLLGAASEAKAQTAREKPYHERNLAVAALVGTLVRARHRGGHDEPAPENSQTDDGTEWRLLWVDLPDLGVVSWHVPESYVPDGLPERPHPWDGHTVDVKNSRLAAFADTPEHVDGEHVDLEALAEESESEPEGPEEPARN